VCEVAGAGVPRGGRGESRASRRQVSVGERAQTCARMSDSQGELASGRLTGVSGVEDPGSPCEPRKALPALSPAGRRPPHTRLPALRRTDGSCRSSGTGSLPPRRRPAYVAPAPRHSPPPDNAVISWTATVAGRAEERPPMAYSRSQGPRLGCRRARTFLSTSENLLRESGARCDQLHDGTTPKRPPAPLAGAHARRWRARPWQRADWTRSRSRRAHRRAAPPPPRGSPGSPQRA
jgi:hypothetical protein